MTTSFRTRCAADNQVATKSTRSLLSTCLDCANVKPSLRVDVQQRARHVIGGTEDDQVRHECVLRHQLSQDSALQGAAGDGSLTRRECDAARNRRPARLLAMETGCWRWRCCALQTSCAREALTGARNARNRGHVRALCGTSSAGASRLPGPGTLWQRCSRLAETSPGGSTSRQAAPGRGSFCAATRSTAQAWVVRFRRWPTSMSWSSCPPLQPMPWRCSPPA